MTPEPQTLLIVLDLIGIAVFAASGALVAVRRGFDVFGVLVLATTTGLGGGFLRDVLIGATPPAALADWRYLLVPAVSGLLTFRFHPALGRARRSMQVLDALGLGLFCVAGALKAADYGLSPLPAALLGMVTGIGGGVIRDVLVADVPIVFQGELYALPALAGAAIAVIGVRLELEQLPVALAGAAVCVGWRLLAIRRGWRAPSAPAPDPRVSGTITGRGLEPGSGRSPRSGPGGAAGRRPRRGRSAGS